MSARSLRRGSIAASRVTASALTMNAYLDLFSGNGYGYLACTASQDLNAISGVLTHNGTTSTMSPSADDGGFGHARLYTDNPGTRSGAWSVIVTFTGGVTATASGASPNSTAGNWPINGSGVYPPAP